MYQSEPLKTGFEVLEEDGVPSDLPVRLRFPNGSITRSQSNELSVNFTTQFLGIFSSAPSNPSQGQTYINSVDNGYYIFYGGQWQLLHTLTPAVDNSHILGINLSLGGLW